ncbi:MAG: zf-HC2 domain-containing protein [Oscillospiraceae bacterium]|nr:zf-HC2 domain-containing protein [Oscillospiraceae bacterium]
MKCHVVQDLLPLYAEQLISAETAADVQAHLAHCEHCAGLYRTANQHAADPIAVPETIDQLKAMRRRSRMHALLAAAVSAWFICLFYIFCVHGFLLRSDRIHMEISTMWQYYTHDGGLRRKDTLAEAEAAMTEDRGRDLQEFVMIRYHGDCLAWRTDGFNTFYARQTDAPDNRAMLDVHTFYATFLPNGLHRSLWARSSCGSPLVDGSTETIRCKDGIFTYDVAQLAALADSSPDGIARLTVGEKLP